MIAASWCSNSAIFARIARMASSLDEKSGWGLFFQPRRSSIGRLVEPYAAVLVMDGQHRNFCDYYRAQSQSDRNIPTPRGDDSWNAMSVMRRDETIGHRR